MCGFIVFVPFLDGDGYMADVTRRPNDAPRGVMQKIMYEAFMTFKSEGRTWCSMALAPLSNLSEGDVGDKNTAKLMQFIYDNLNGIYGFQDLRTAKERYNPTIWIPGYFTYYPRIISPQLAYASVAIQNPKGMGNYIAAFFSSTSKKWKKKWEEFKERKPISNDEVKKFEENIKMQHENGEQVNQNAK
jgi:phosphatidylglycerol lysyltransferase